MKYTATFAADAANTKICDVIRRHDANDWFASVYVSSSDFGSGTITLFVSPDGGTTKIALKDAISGTAISATASSMFTVRLGDGNKNTDAPIVYATLAGSTDPDPVTVAIFDNR